MPAPSWALETRLPATSPKSACCLLCWSQLYRTGNAQVFIKGLIGVWGSPAWGRDHVGHLVSTAAGVRDELGTQS